MKMKKNWDIQFQSLKDYPTILKFRLQKILDFAVDCRYEMPPWNRPIWSQNRSSYKKRRRNYIFIIPNLLFLLTLFRWRWKTRPFAVPCRRSTRRPWRTCWTNATPTTWPLRPRPTWTWWRAATRATCPLAAIQLKWMCSICRRRWYQTYIFLDWWRLIAR